MNFPLTAADVPATDTETVAEQSPSGKNSSPGLLALNGVSRETLENQFLAWNLPKFRASQVLKWIFDRRVQSFQEMTDLPRPLREHLAQVCVLSRPEIVLVKKSVDGTRKFLFRLADGNLIESVLIPATPGSRSQADRRTLCVSSQVGCAYGCKFCASGLMGWTRHLTPAEIVGQVMQAEDHSGERVDNLVFMGMGEPFANYANLMAAIEILNAPWGVGIGARHITVSTSGLAPKIRELADQPLQVRLAISLHGATDDIRQQIMPINRKYPVEVLLEACWYFQERKKQKITFEYILIDGLNDTLEQGNALADALRGLDCKVNLIPYNTVTGLTWERPSRRRQEVFRDALTRAGVLATIRTEKGHDIDAACGQLRLQHLGEELSRAGGDA